MRIDKEATQRIVKNALGSQLREDDQKRRMRNLMSSDSEEAAPEDKPTKDSKDKTKSVQKLA